MITGGKMKTKLSSVQLTILGLMSAILLIMAYTPLGYFNIGPLAVTLNVIPVAIAAIAVGPIGGAVAGGVFGLTSFLQCIGIGGISMMGSALFAINPFFAFIQTFVPRFINGFLLGYIFIFLRQISKKVSVSSFITGFFSAFLNTLFFMTLLAVLFGNTEYIKGMTGGRNIIIFFCGLVGVNAVSEMICSTLFTGIIAMALYKAKLLLPEQRK